MADQPLETVQPISDSRHPLRRRINHKRMNMIVWFMMKTAARFQEFGCTTCHQIVTHRRMGLTSYGAKLKSMHLACTDVERILSHQR
jgi:hypothetical protein